MIFVFCVNETHRDPMAAHRGAAMRDRVQQQWNFRIAVQFVVDPDAM
jgi:hypothetical protein